MSQRARLDDPPHVDIALVEWLEKAYSPRCYDPRAETLEDHLRYAGQVELVAMLRGTSEEQREEIAPGITGDDGDASASIPLQPVTDTGD